jgi:hypothetical protein
MNQDKIWTHITRKIAGENTEDDTLKVDEWLKEKPENTEIYSQLKEVWNFNPLEGGSVFTKADPNGIFSAVR